MRLSRLTTRRLMVLVAVVGTVLGMAARFVRLRSEYGVRAVAFAGREASSQSKIARFDRMVGKGDREIWAAMPKPEPGPEFDSFVEGLRIKRWSMVVERERFGELKRKYGRAARYPWLPVPADPSLPK